MSTILGFLFNRFSFTLVVVAVVVLLVVSGRLIWNKYTIGGLAALVIVVSAWTGVEHWANNIRAEEREIWVKKIDEYKAKLLDNQKVYDLLVTKLKSDNLELVLTLELKLKASETRKNRVKTIVKEVVKYVTPKADNQCTLTAGAEWVLNSAISSTEIQKPVDVDIPLEAPLSQVLAITAENLAECKVRGEVITAWQEWYARSKADWDKLRTSIPKDPEIPH